MIMSLISLQNSSELEVTILSNRFIDNFMPRANGGVRKGIYLPSPDGICRSFFFQPGAYGRQPFLHGKRYFPCAEILGR